MAVSLNPRQLGLLGRIVNDGHPPTSKEATSVYALRSRGLVTTTSSFAYHTAAATEPGRDLIEHGPSRSTPSTTTPSSRTDGQPLDGEIPATLDELISLIDSEGGYRLDNRR